MHGLHTRRIKGLGILRIDARLRKNIEVSIDDMATIRKADAKDAKSILLKPHQVKIKSNARFESFVKRRLLELSCYKRRFDIH